MRRRLRFVGLLGGALLALLRVAGQPRSFESLWAEIYKSAWAGIYTNDQAARGESFYNARCASCHGTSLEGSEEGPPLRGRDFANDWNCANIADLFEKIQFTMPTDRPGRLSREQIADVLAYILRANRFPAGASALPASADELRGIRFLARNPGQ
ncbi:MAG: cytochrome c [Acidobacteriia bacterium]|nr:cytochrome c [Terriglobia bacterium]